MTLSIPIERLRKSFTYDPETGVFCRRSRPGVPCGGRTGGIYLCLKIDGVNYMAHRCAWAYVFGVQPPPGLDHIDGDGSANRIANLRPCTSAENQQNRSARSSRGVGLLGVTRVPGNRYAARIRVNGVLHNLGYRGSPEGAHQLYLEAKRRLHKFQPVPRGG